MIDSRNINDLHKTVKRGCLELKKRLKEHGYDMGISSTYRDFEMQDYLYAQGRTRPGNIITNAKGGESIHNYRLAFDIFNNVVNNMYDKIFLDLAGKIGREMGFDWGGDWTSFVDMPHFEFTGSLSLQDLQNGKTLPDDILMSWEVETMDEQISEIKTEIKDLGMKVDNIKNDVNFLKDNIPAVYKTLDDVPAWGKATVENLIHDGRLHGLTSDNLGLTKDMIRVLTIITR